MSLIIFTAIYITVFVLDILFSLWYVPKKPKNDKWKIIVFLITAIIIVLCGLQVVTDWYRIFYLLPFYCFLYWQAKDFTLGIIWHKNPLYLSKNHWPDSMFGSGDGGWLALIRAFGMAITFPLINYIHYGSIFE